MQYDELLALLTRARVVLDRYVFDEAGDITRDDVAEVCMAIDDAMPIEGRVQLEPASLERSAA